MIACHVEITFAIQTLKQNSQVLEFPLRNAKPRSLNQTVLISASASASATLPSTTIKYEYRYSYRYRYGLGRSSILLVWLSVERLTVLVWSFTSLHFAFHRLTIVQHCITITCCLRSLSLSIFIVSVSVSISISLLYFHTFCFLTTRLPVSPLTFARSVLSVLLSSCEPSPSVLVYLPAVDGCR